MAHQPCYPAHQFVRDCDPIQLAVAPLHLVVRGAAIRLLCTRLPTVRTAFYAPEATSLPTGLGDAVRASRLCCCPLNDWSSTLWTLQAGPKWLRHTLNYTTIISHVNTKVNH